MAHDEVVHVAVAPPAKIDPDALRSVAAIINKSPSQTRLLLAGDVPRLIAQYDSIQAAECTVRNLRDLGLAAIVCRDSELRRIPQPLRAHTLELREKEVLFRDSRGREKRVVEDHVFLILVGRIEASLETETTKPRTKLSVTGTLLTGGIPVWRRVDEKTTVRSVEAEYFARLYHRGAPEPDVEILQHHVNYSFLGAKLAASSFVNFDTLVQVLRQVFPQAILDSRLVRPSLQAASTGRAWEDAETRCKLIYLFHALVSGLDPST